MCSFSHVTSDELRQLYLNSDMQTFTTDAPNTHDALINQLVSEAHQDVVWNINSFEAGISSCACAIYDHTGRVILAINMTGPDAYFKTDTQGLLNIKHKMRDPRRRSHQN